MRPIFFGAHKQVCNNGQKHARELPRDKFLENSAKKNSRLDYCDQWNAQFLSFLPLIDISVRFQGGLFLLANAPSNVISALFGVAQKRNLHFS
jgi:hypothetical protein